jgi:hypothetical protein
MLHSCTTSVKSNKVVEAHYISTGYYYATESYITHEKVTHTKSWPVVTSACTTFTVSHHK